VLKGFSKSPTFDAVMYKVFNGKVLKLGDLIINFVVMFAF